MPCRFAVSSFVLVALLLAAVYVNAQEAPAADNAPANTGDASDQKATPEPVETGQIDKWIKQLDSDQFAERDAASRQLREAGPAAIVALKRAADGNNPEAASRAFEILKKHLRGDSTAAKQKAKSALESLTSSTKRHVALRAKKLLEEKPATPPRPNNVFGPFGGIRIGPGGFGGAARVVRIQIGNVNGDRDVQVDDGTRKVRITENKKDGITVSVTEKVEGKEKTTKYTAKDKEELKKKHPEGYKLYKQYAGGIGAVKIGGFGGRIELKPLLPGDLRGADERLRKAREQQEKIFKQLQKQIEAIQKGVDPRGIDLDDDVKKAIEQLRKQLEGIRPQPPKVDRAKDAKKRVESLSRQIKQLEQRKQELQRQLEEAQKAAKEKDE